MARLTIQLSVDEAADLVGALIFALKQEKSEMFPESRKKIRDLARKVNEEYRAQLSDQERRALPSNGTIVELIEKYGA